MNADAQYAQEVAAQEVAAQEQRHAMRVQAQRASSDSGGGQRRQRRTVLLRDDLWPVIRRHRQSLAGLIIFDLFFLAVLLLQLTPGGFPQSMDEFSPRLEARETYSDVWLAIIVSASAFPVIGLLGALILLRPALWAYCVFLLAAVVFRLYLTYEASYKEGIACGETTELCRRRLLIDEALFTLGILFQLQASRSEACVVP